MNKPMLPGLGAPPPQVGPMIVPFDVTDIVGAKMREDGGAIAISLAVSSGDRVLMGLSPAGVDAMLETLKKIRAELDNKGVQATIPLSAVSTCAAGVHDIEGVPLVSLLIDRSLSSAAGFLMPPKSARTIGRQLIAKARIASSRRGEPAEDDDSEA